MLSALCYLVVVVLCAVNLWWDGTVELEWFFGLTALGLLLAALGVGPAVPALRGRNAQ